MSTFKVSKAATIEALKHAATTSGGEIIVKSGDGQIKLTGENPTFSVSLSVPVEGEIGANEKVVDGKKLLSFMRASVGQDCVIDLDKRKFKVGRGTCSFPEREQSYHFSSEDISTPGTKLALATLAPAIEACVAATGTDTTRGWSTGVHFTGEDAYGTDGHRLVRARGVLCPELAGVTIPAVALTALLRIATGDVEVRVGPGAIEFFGVGFSLRTRLIADQYPNTEPVFVRVDGIASAEFAEGDLQQAIGLISSTGPDAIRISVADDGGMGLESLDVTNDLRTSVEIQQGKLGIAEGVIAVKAKYISGLVGIFGDASAIQLAVTGDSDPIAISSADQPGILAVVMPMRV